MWQGLRVALEAEHVRQRAASEASRQISRHCRLGMVHFHVGELKEAQAQCDAARAVPVDDFSVDALCTLMACLSFVEHGVFPPPHHDDMDYLSGLLGAAQELTRYSVRSATKGDLETVAKVSAAVTSLQGEMLEFDLRNGPLRKKYDGLKYASRRLSDLLYEQSLLDRTVEIPTMDFSLKDIRERYAEADAAREAVIKQARDVQKASKNSIFATHRGDTHKAKNLIEKAAEQAKPLLASPWRKSLDLEEWAEACLFLDWIETKEITDKNLLSLPLTNEEYLGGVADLTGEIGRLAVEAAAKRKIDDVTAVYDTCHLVLREFTSLELPGKIIKKMDALHATIRKIETILYELSLKLDPPRG